MDPKEIAKAEEAAMSNKYDKGYWKESIIDLTALLEFASPAKKTEINMDIGWNNWKMRLKDEAAEIAKAVLADKETTDIAKSSAHSLLSLYYSEKPDKKIEASEHARLAQELTSSSGLRHRVNLNSCVIALGNMGDLTRAEQVFQKVAMENEKVEKTGNAKEVEKSKHQRGKNGYNFVSKVLIPQGRFDEAGKELIRNVIPRYMEVGAYTDLAAAYHQLSVVYRKQKKLKEALSYERMSLVLWEEYSDDPTRAPQAEKNIKDILAEMQEHNGEQKQGKIEEPERKISARDK